ncbi:DNA internalization-related competence protein ComEC/Rec2 [Marinicrinis sediminis]|uniref:DNA internalization-related competence protein ComEC/Rec2 n=1 Tax=Marinicrinis sediminis TaxID=1652465 RepID=A0ABW5R9D3_9BACL
MGRVMVPFVCSWLVGTAWGIDQLSSIYAVGFLMGIAFWLLRDALLHDRSLEGKLSLTKLVYHLVCMTACIAIAFGYADMTERHNRSAISPSMQETEVRLTGWIASPVEIDGDRAKLLVEARDWRDVEKDARDSTFSAELDESILIYIKLQEESQQHDMLDWKRGDLVQVRGKLLQPMSATNFGAFDYARYLHTKRIHWQLFVEGSFSMASISMEEMHLTGIDRWRHKLEQWKGWRDARQLQMAQQLENTYTDPAFSGFLKGMLLGYREDINEEQFRQFSVLGLTHLLAISGLHVGVLSGLLLLMGRWMRLTRERAIYVAMTVIPCYVLLTGASPSAIRAGIMTILALYAIRNNLSSNRYQLLALAAFLMVLADPYMLTSISFQLSFMVTAGLLVIVPVLYNWLPGPAWLRSLLGVTFAAQGISLPLTIYYFHSFSLLSWLANLLMVPWISMVVFPLSLFAYVLSGVTFVSLLLSTTVSIALKISFAWVEWLNQFDVFHLIWKQPSLLWIAVYTLFLFWLIRELERLKLEQAWNGGLKRHVDHLHLRCCGILAGLFLLVVYQYLSPQFHKGEGYVYFMDVGQGDSSLIITPSHETILVDGGGTLSFLSSKESWMQRKDEFEVGEDVVVPLLKQRGIREIDWMIASHGDQDHIGGFFAVLEAIPVRNLIFNGLVEPGSRAEELIQTAASYNIPIYIPAEGMQLQVDEHTRIAFLMPFDQPEPIFRHGDQNEVSIVMKLSMYDHQFLYTGDIGIPQEMALIHHLEEEGASISGTEKEAIDVLKVAHHGSKYSTSPAWLAYWNPQQAVISVGGRNVYGHPTREVIESLSASGTRVFRTDRHGEVQYRVTPSDMEVRTKLQRP